MLVHVEDFTFAEQWADGDVIKVKRAKPYHLGYVTKQRLPLSPDFEATCGHRRQSSEKIVGVRISFTADAKALIASQHTRPGPRAPLPSISAVGPRPEEIRAA
jgi:hypothetical protein